MIAYWVFRPLLLSAFIREICGQEFGSPSPIGYGTCGVGQLTVSGLWTRSFIDQETSAQKPPGTVRWAEKKGQAEGGQTNNPSVGISKLDPEPVACRDESTSNFLSADFADERRWGESQRRSVVGSIGGSGNP